MDGEPVTILHEDPKDQSRLMVKVGGLKDPTSFSKRLIRES